MGDDYLVRIGRLIRDARQHRGWTQSHLAEALGTSQSAVNRIERGNQNISLEMIARIGEALDSEIVSLGYAGPMHLRVVGGRRLSGGIDVRTSKNACVALLCATLLNSGRTILRRVARIEEVYRILEVLGSVGVRTRWINDGADLEIVPPDRLELDSMDMEAARRTRSVIMFLGPLLHREDRFRIPYAGGCDLGTRTVQPHMTALRRFGLEITATDGIYHAEVDRSIRPDRPIVLTERGDTVTENALLAAARHDGVTVIRNASSNYMVQDLCFFLEQLGVTVEGVGTTTLTVHGVPHIDRDVDYSPSEDPVEAMSLLAAALVTESELTIRRVPVEFLEIELAVLEEMGLDHERSPEYPADNGRTRLIDLTVRPSKLKAPIDKIHPMPFPGLNIDNVPFFAAIAATAQGSSLIHDWVYDNRAIYLTDLNRLGADVKLLDPHRVLVEGPTRWRAAEMMCPPALRPAVVILLAMMAAEGTSVLRNVYVINRGYEELAERLNSVGAQIEIFRDI
ncbi:MULTISPECIES: helix-turn-helix domain-containing protein [Streptomyces]|uniref:UDP-N-acetylglucosamine 1-carboxyvinyltransferase n=2 Tax=Streptomyces TaxID=1883 RepID=A0A420V370_9ACTN|nr:MULTISPECIES: UDP-N-acetylglucosamine 1-carboxyvinyltransferase [Streptomyces]KNE84314.1 UDP-N-acetylglucosamine 1-carboxyvinyltransferase [Streptomyces fradiae]OFA58899.1 UDP-N-acetylglucosamine 1-carboxyvinyltransferase [Streptomyces fradiae]PQM22173.1 UDP-N-acetylglucosamine 1-carboxyvinyltransferase [Streptomyces xinghaiensis]RKM95425.1 UDP-N-acetylglucosamine 1-carboxyvinyltransferase [Streptomyces xinghaiensis]RNC73009.1 UDP-N-acetylglucosamine 1-carboxyvinyltransferase [Streptomyces 